MYLNFATINRLKHCCRVVGGKEVLEGGKVGWSMKNKIKDVESILRKMSATFLILQKTQKRCRGGKGREVGGWKYIVHILIYLK